MIRKETLNEEEIEFRSMEQCTFAEALALWNEGFSGYYSDMTHTPASLVAHMGRAGFHPELSVAAFVSGQPAGFVLIGAKIVNGQFIAWNGGTGVAPPFRGRGLAKRLMQQAAAGLRKAGVALAALEVVKHNAAAVKAYRQAGFAVADELIGLQHSGPLDARAFHPHPAAAEMTEEKLTEGKRNEAELAGEKLNETGLTKEKLNETELADAKLTGYRMESASPAAISRLPFYRHNAAWLSQWHNIHPCRGLIVYDRAGAAAGYALAKPSYSNEGELQAVALIHCETAPDHPDEETIVRMLLLHAFGPARQAMTRTTYNLSQTAQTAIRLMREAGFETVYEQYLMHARL